MNERFVYLLVDYYEEHQVITALVFKEELTREKRIEIQNKINDLKDELCDNEWQFDDILDRLAEVYNFDELDIMPYKFTM